MEYFRTVCPYCASGCQLYLQVEGGDVVGVAPSLKHPVSSGKLAARGWACHEMIGSDQRLATPMVRKGNALVETSWEEALSFVAAEFKRLRDAHGGDALGVVGSAHCTNEDNFVLAKFARAVLQTHHVDFTARGTHAASVASLVAMTGLPVMGCSIQEIGDANTILVCGADLSEQSPLVFCQVARAHAEGARVLVVDSRKTKVAGLAAIHLAPRPGTELTLFAGMIRLAITENWFDQAFVSANCLDYGDLVESVKGFTPERVESDTGISADALRGATQLYASADKSVVLYSTGITQHATSEANVAALANLALITGHMGRPGCGLGPLVEHCNTVGACDMGVMPDYLPGYQPVADRAAREVFEKAWGVALPDFQGLSAHQMLAHAGRLKGLLVMGDDPVNNSAHPERARAALRGLELLVVQDLFLTETAKLAHVVLPSASFAEKDGTFTSMERRVQRLHQAVPPRGGAREDWKVLCEIAHNMGYRMNFSRAEDVMREIAALNPHYAGVSHASLPEQGLQWPCPEAGHAGTPTLPPCGFSQTKARLMPIPEPSTHEEADSEYPFLMTVGRSYWYWSESIRVKQSPTLNREYALPFADFPKGFVEMHPSDGRALQVRGGASIKVISRQGEMQIPVRLTDVIAEKTLVLPYPLRDKASALYDAAADPTSSWPHFPTCAVRVERCA